MEGSCGRHKYVVMYLRKSLDIELLVEASLGGQGLVLVHHEPPRGQVSTSLTVSEARIKVRRIIQAVQFEAQSHSRQMTSRLRP